MNKKPYGQMLHFLHNALVHAFEIADTLHVNPCDECPDHRAIIIEIRDQIAQALIETGRITPIAWKSCEEEQL